jgi:hypothetical protein
MKRLDENFLPPSHLNHASQIEHGDPLSDLLDDREVVRDEDHRQGQPPSQVKKEMQDLCLNRDVECRHRLVEHQQLGPQGQSPGNSQSLPLASRELVRIALEDRFTKPHRVEQGADLRRLLFRGEAAMKAQGLSEEISGPPARIKSRGRILKDHLHSLPQTSQLGPASRQEILAREAHASGVGLEETHDQSAEGGLAASRLSDKPQALPWMDVEVDSIDRHQAALAPQRTPPEKRARDLADLDQRLSRAQTVSSPVA